MAIRLGNAPCSWGVEFAEDNRNPSWETVLKECAAAGYQGIELGPIGFMPEEPSILRDALAVYELELIGGVVFRPFHDPKQWNEVWDAANRTCKALAAHNAQHLVLIDSISQRRALTAGRANEAEQMSKPELNAYIDRFRTIAAMGTEEYGLTVSLHPHAGGFTDFLPEIEYMLEQIDARILKLCVDTGHSTYAGFDPIEFIQRYIDRISYLHFKSIDPKVKKQVISNRIDFYQACSQGLFCNLSVGEVDFAALHQVLMKGCYSGWCTVEQDCDPGLCSDTLGNAIKNREFLESLGYCL